MRFSTMWVLLVGKRMGKLERNFIQTLHEGQLATKLDNKSIGGEGIHPKSARFLYVAFRRKGSGAAAAAQSRASSSSGP